MSSKVLLSRKSKKQFQKALDLRNEGQFVQSIPILTEIIREYPAYSTAYLILGSSYWEIGELDQAIIIFRQGVKLKPKAKYHSLCLIDTLLESGKTKEAKDELERFLTHKKTEEHLSLYKKITQL